jgi:hypothetical protein
MTMSNVKTGRKWVKQDLTPDQFRDKRKQEVTAMFAALDEWKEDLSEAALAELLAKFDNYHGVNPLFIEMGSQGLATDVDARGAWHERGYVPIGKGTGIPIVSPERRVVDDKDNPGKKKEIVTGWHKTFVWDIRHVIDPDLREQWNKDHDPDENGNRHWGDEDEIKAWHEKWDKTV